MELNELRQKNASELEAHLLELRREQFNLRMQKGSGQMSQSHQFGRVRREIAQVKYLLGTRKQESQPRKSPYPGQSRAEVSKRTSTVRFGALTAS